MSEKTLKTRIVHKHDTETNWLKATTFIPKQGEIIVYDIDTTYNYERFKIGDGATVVSSLPFTYDAALTDALAQAKESGEFDGTDGISATHSWNGTTLTITSASGTSSANLKGATGDAGVGVSSVKQTTTSTADDGNNIITVTLTDGTTSTFTIQNGSKGSAGSKGDTGEDGYSPVRGTDYWTEADKAEIKSYVDDAILNGEW